MGKMGRKPWYDKNGVKKGAWSKEEDDKLRSYIQKYGHWNWSQLPKFADRIFFFQFPFALILPRIGIWLFLSDENHFKGLSRCGKSCRLRWLNYLRQNIKRGNFSKEEEDLIIKLRDEHGNKWANIATKLSGRTDNEIKNYWHSKLNKQVKQNSSISKTLKNSLINSLSGANKKAFAQENVDSEDALSQPSSERCSNFFESSSNELYSSDFDYALLSDINYWNAEGNCISSAEAYYEPIDNIWTKPFLPEKTYNQNDFQPCTLEGHFMSAHGSYFDDGIHFSDQILMKELL